MSALPYVQIIITMLKEVNTKSGTDLYYFFRISRGAFHWYWKDQAGTSCLFFLRKKKGTIPKFQSKKEHS